jgi:hypothetical protein
MGGVSGVGMAVNRPSALVRVCLACHGAIESQRSAAELLGLLVPRPGVPAETPVRLSPVYGAGWWLLSDEGDYGWWHGEVPPARDVYTACLRLGLDIVPV